MFGGEAEGVVFLGFGGAVVRGGFFLIGGVLVVDHSFLFAGRGLVGIGEVVDVGLAVAVHVDAQAGMAFGGYADDSLGTQGLGTVLGVTAECHDHALWVALLTATEPRRVVEVVFHLPCVGIHGLPLGFADLHGGFLPIWITQHDRGWTVRGELGEFTD